jgi:hypothetical protein
VAFNLVTSPSIYVDGTLAGSAAGVWTDGAANLYVLSAAHVVGGVPPHTPVQWLSLDGSVGVGQTVDAELTWLQMQGGGRLDAGLVRIVDAGPFASSEDYPWASEIAPLAEVHHIESVVICGKSGPVAAVFDRVIPAGQAFPAGRVHGRLLQFRYEFGETQPGDSGGAVISLPEGRLVGIHVAEHLAAGVSYAWAIAAEDMFDAFEDPLPGFRSALIG